MQMSMQMNHCQAIKQKLPHSATENPRKVQSNFFLCEYANEDAKGYANETPKKTPTWVASRPFLPSGPLIPLFTCN